MNRFVEPDPNDDHEADLGFDRQPSALSNIALAIMVWGSFILVVCAIWYGVAEALR